METTISSYEQQALDFLQATQTKFESVFKTFDSMPFDKNGEKRNIFSITLSNDKHKYSFDFGSSLADSCKPYPMIYSKEKTQIYYGVRFGRSDSGITFSFQILTDYPTLLLIKESKDYDSIIDYRELQNRFDDYNQDVAKYNRSAKAKVSGKMFCKDINDFIHGIKQAIADKIKKAEDEETFLGQQSDEIKHPTAYDVLACIQKYDPGTFENFCSDFGYDTDSRSAVKFYKAVRKEWNNVSKLFTESEIEQLQEIN